MARALGRFRSRALPTTCAAELAARRGQRRRGSAHRARTPARDAPTRAPLPALQALDDGTLRDRRTRRHLHRRRERSTTPALSDGPRTPSGALLDARGRQLACARLLLPALAALKLSSPQPRRSAERGRGAREAPERRHRADRARRARQGARRRDPRGARARAGAEPISRATDPAASHVGARGHRQER